MLPTLIFLLFTFSARAVSLSQKGNQAVIAPDGPYWTSECERQDIPQSPINIKPPFTYMNFDATFNFHPQHSAELFNDRGNNLKMDGDFGFFEYNGKIFNSYELSFKAPSEHTFGAENKRFPLEMQIASISPEGVRIVLAIMFSESEEDGEFLSSFGFGDGLLQHLSINQYYEVKKPVDISIVIPTDNRFFIYEGTKTTPPCEPALWLVAFQTYKASSRQLNDFPKQLLNKERALSPITRQVYSTFDPRREKTLGSQASTTNQTTTNNTRPIPIPPKLKSPNVDSFIIVGDDTPYEDEIYPALRDIPNPRPLKKEDYIIITNPPCNNSANVTTNETSPHHRHPKHHKNDGNKTEEIVFQPNNSTSSTETNQPNNTESSLANNESETTPSTELPQESSTTPSDQSSTLTSETQKSQETSDTSSSQLNAANSENQENTTPSTQSETITSENQEISTPPLAQSDLNSEAQESQTSSITSATESETQESKETSSSDSKSLIEKRLNSNLKEEEKESTSTSVYEPKHSNQFRRHRGGKDPSSFFSAFHDEPNSFPEEGAPLSFLALGPDTKPEILQKNGRSKKFLEREFENLNSPKTSSEFTGRKNLLEMNNLKKSKWKKKSSREE